MPDRGEAGRGEAEEAGRPNLLLTGAGWHAWDAPLA